MENIQFTKDNYFSTFNHDILNIYDHNPSTDENILLTSITFNNIIYSEDLEQIFHSYITSIQ